MLTIKKINIDNIVEIIEGIIDNKYNSLTVNNDNQVIAEKSKYADTKPLEDRTNQKNTEVSPLYNKIRKILNGGFIKSSSIAYELFPEYDKGTSRSLFRKKLYKMNTSDEGGGSDVKYEFTDEELKKINSILVQVCSSSSGKKGNEQ